MNTFLLLGLLVGGPAVVGVMAGFNLFRLHGIVPRKFRPGAPIIYRVQETSNHPVHDATEVYPAERGECYYYVTNKYWRVEEVLQDGWIVARTPLMEQHYLRRDDPNLRKASVVERLRYAARFPYAA